MERSSGLDWKWFSHKLSITFVCIIPGKNMEKEVMGGGDIKLLFVTGMYIGWEENLLAIFVACIIGIIVGLRLEQKEDDGGYFPFGPSIAVGAAVSMLYGTRFIEVYMSLF